MHKQPEVTEKTRQTFINVFCQLYAEKPIEKISVQEITRKADYNRSTFYQYFSDIYELRNEIENDVLDFISEELSASDTQPYDEQAVLRNALKLFNEKEVYLNALMGDYGSVRFQKRLKERMPLGTGMAQQLSESSYFPYLLEFHVSTLLSMFHLWQSRGRDLTADQLFELIYRLYSTGLQSFTQ